MGLATRLQLYLRHTAHLQFPALSLPGFTLFHHPTDTDPEANYALPNDPSQDALPEALDRLRAACARLVRLPRTVFVEAFAPTLATGLRTNGFVETSRAPLLVCTPETFRPPQPPRGLSIVLLDVDGPDDVLRTHLEVQSRGFDPRSTERFDDGAVQRFRRELPELRACTAYLDGVPAGIAVSLPPYGGLAELVGITTLAPFRRQGIGGSLTAALARRAFASRVDTVFLVAADEDAVRIYTRIGFQAGGTLLTFDDASAGLSTHGA